MDPHRPGDRATRAGALLAALWLILLAAVDVLVPSKVVPDPRSRLRRSSPARSFDRITAAFGVAAVGLLVASGW